MRWSGPRRSDPAIMCLVPLGILMSHLIGINLGRVKGPPMNNPYHSGDSKGFKSSVPGKATKTKYSYIMPQVDNTHLCT